ncbi:MAG: hypothetical protein JO360_06895 [Acidobacteria bacterium]|nr:hypothetical protein [Acidobacteriota bacterium]
MAVKKRRRLRHRHYSGRKDETAAELSDRLAPPEEHPALSAAPVADDTIVLDTGKLKIPHALLEEDEEERRILGLEPVVLVILLVVLTFIAFIAYLIYKMPN